jgi:hypothetical protein
MRQCGGGEATDSSVEKLLILVKLNNMFRGCSIVKEASPRFVTVTCVTASTAGGLKACRGTFRLLRQVALRGIHGQSSPIAGIGLFYKTYDSTRDSHCELLPAGGRATSNGFSNDFSAIFDSRRSPSEYNAARLFAGL